MSGTLLVVNLIVAIALMIALILIPKLNPAISLVIASIYMGVSCGLGFVTSIDTIASGFGNMMASIGLPIGFGVILGQLMSDTGAAKVIAKTIVHSVPNKFVLYAVAIAGFILAIPVFFDVTFIILIPIGIAVAKEVNKPLAYVVGALTIGDGIAQTLVPPTPNPLAAADLLHFNLGTMVIMGLIIGAIATVVSVFIYTKIHDTGFFKPEKDMNPNAELFSEEKELESDKQPSFLVSFLPILIPVVCILTGTGADAIYDETPMVAQFLGNKIIAILLGTLCSYLIGYKYLGRDKVEASAGEALKQAGIVLLITGAGGSFGSIISATDIGNALVTTLSINSGSVIKVLFLAYFIGCIFRIAQGSGTVAGITAMTIMATIAPSVSIHPVYIALAALAGGISVGHVNDSGFWVVSNLSGFTVTGGLKTYTVAQIIMSISIMILTLLFALILPGAIGCSFSRKTQKLFA